MAILSDLKPSLTDMNYEDLLSHIRELRLRRSKPVTKLTKKAANPIDKMVKRIGRLSLSQVEALVRIIEANYE